MYRDNKIITKRREKHLHFMFVIHENTWRSGLKSNSRKKIFRVPPTGVEPMTFQNTGWNGFQ